MQDRSRAVDPDVDLHVPGQRGECTVPVLAAIALGGGLGGLARYGLELALPAHPGRIPWGTVTANVLGCLLIGVLMALITEVWPPHRLVRPFLGVGLLGGFTTFSTYAVEIRGLLVAGSVPLAGLPRRHPAELPARDPHRGHTHPSRYPISAEKAMTVQA